MSTILTVKNFQYIKKVAAHRENYYFLKEDVVFSSYKASAIRQSMLSCLLTDTPRYISAVSKPMPHP